MLRKQPGLFNPLTPLAAVLKDFARQQGLVSRYRHYQVWRRWEDVVGPRLVTKAWPVALRNNVLFVRTADAVWMQELALHKGEIVARVQEIAGKSINDIRFVWGEETTASEHGDPRLLLSPGTLNGTRVPRPEEPPCAEEDVAAAAAVAARLNDDEGREVLRRVVLYDLTRSRRLLDASLREVAQEADEESQDGLK